MRVALRIAASMAIFAIATTSGVFGFIADSGAEPTSFNPYLTGLKAATFNLQCPPGPAPIGHRSRCFAHQIPATLRIRPEGASDPPRTLRTAKDGRATVILPPGTYRVRPLILYIHHVAQGPPPEPQEVTVRPDTFTGVIVDYDSYVKGAAPRR